MSKNSEMRKLEIPQRSPRDKQMSFRLSTELFDRIEAVTVKTQQDRSEVLIYLLEWALDAWDEQNSSAAEMKNKK